MIKDSCFFRGIVASAMVAILMCGSVARAQTAPVYYGPLLYRTAFDTLGAPLYVGQPPAVTTAYLWFDEAMRLNTKPQIMSYFKRMMWDDTAKFITSNLYQIQDDNPLSLYDWTGNWNHPNPYKCQPNVAKENFWEEIKNLLGYRTYALLSTDFIDDVVVSDTIHKFDPTAMNAPDQILVTTTILDCIKGQHVPACYDMLKTRKKGASPQYIVPTVASWVSTTPATAGTCFEFQYSPEWSGDPTDDEGLTQLKYPTGGSWIQPDSEYIVFLGFIGVGLDSTSMYFSVFPGGFGTMGGMYPVIAGKVFDPNDDFGIGASTGLTVAAWKSKVRSLIYGLVHP